MRIAIRRASTGGWSVIAQEGRFNGKEIAVVEGISLSNVIFNGRQIIGFGSGVWGATVHDFVHECAKTLRALGINRPFDSRARFPVILTDDGFFRDAATQAIVRVAQQVNAYQSGRVFYR